VENTGTSVVVIKDYEGYSDFVMEIPPGEVRVSHEITYDVIERLQTQLNAVPTLVWNVLNEPFSSGGGDVQDSVESRTGTPPVAPGIGERYLITTGTGVWLGHDGEIAEWNGSAWEFTSPTEGTMVWVSDENVQYVYEDGAWRLSTLPARSYDNTTRPDASTVVRGTPIFNTDDNAPNWSDGTNWRDAAGNLT